MNDHQCFNQFLYGRNEEVERLHEIVRTVLNPVNASKHGSDGHECARESNMTGQKTCCAREARATNQDGSNSNDTKSACWNDDGKSPCQMVLVCGPAGSGKRTFVRGAFHKFGGARYSMASQNKSPQSQTQSYILTSGRFRQNSRQNTDSPSSEAASNVWDDDISQLSAFKDAFLEIQDVLRNDEMMLETIHQKLMQSLVEYSDSDLDLLNEVFPCLQKWSRLDSRRPSTVPQMSDEHQKLPSPISITSCAPTSARRVHVIHQQTQLLCDILNRFLRAVSSVIPIVFILEDLQHADATSLTLIEKMLTYSEQHDDVQQNSCSKGILLVTTYTVDANVGKASALTSFLKRYGPCSVDCALLTVEDEEIDLTRNGSLSTTDISQGLKTTALFDQRICITEYSWEDVHQWIKECEGNIQKCTTAQKQDLTHIVFHSSNGNPLHVRYLLVLLEHDEAIFREDINKKRLPKSMNDIFASIFLHQNKAVQYMLKTAAALAHCGLQDIGCNILQVSVNQSCTEDILIAQRYGLIEYRQGYVKFYSQEVENAVYKQIPFSDRSSFHLEIGRRIWRDATMDETKESKNSLEIIGNVVLATSQFRCIDRTCIDFDEYLYMSKSCYDVGKEALFNRDFYNAAKLFEFSIYVLGQNLWRDDLYETSLVLHNAASQAYCYMGEYVCLQRILDAIFDNALTFHDKLPAYVTLCYFQGSWHDLREAFRTAATTLKELGEHVNQNPSGLTVAWSLIKTKLTLVGKSIDYLVNLPVMENDVDLAIAQLLSFASIYSYIVKPEASILLCFRLIHLAIEKGMSGPSAVAFCTYGFVLCALGNFKEGYLYGQVAMELANKFEVWRPRIFMFYFGYIYQWTHPIRHCVAPLKEASQSAMINGDLEIYFGAAFYLNETSFFAGTSLRTLEPLARSYCQSAALSKQKNALLSLCPQFSLLKDLVCDDEPLNLPGDVTDTETAFKYAVKEDNKYVVGAVYVYRTMWYYLNGDYISALETARKAMEQRQLADFALTFYEGLAAVALASTFKSQRRRKYRNLGQVMAQQLKNWARRCADNFLNKQLLLKAEIAGLYGKTTSALSLYQRSIDKAVEVGFGHEEGIAYECLGRYQLNLGRHSDASESYTNARNAFEKWGAIRLVRRMDEILATI